MKYKHVFDKMPAFMLEQLQIQGWALPYLQQGSELSELLASEGIMRELQHNKLNRSERVVLQHIVTLIGSDMFTLDQLGKQVGIYRSGAELRVALEGLRKYGIIASFRKSWGDLLYALPEDGFAVWQQLLLSGIQTMTEAELDGLERTESELTAGGSRGIAQELFTLLAFAAQEDLIVTAKGLLHKKQLQKLMERLHLPQAGCEGAETTYLAAGGAAGSWSGAYEFGFALLLHCALSQGLLVQESSVFKLNKEALALWLELSFEEQQVRLYELWKGLFLNVPVWLQHCIAWIEKLSPERWCAVDDIVQWLLYHQIPQDFSGQKELEEALLRQWLVHLQAYRWLDIAVDKKGELWIQSLMSERMEMRLAGTTGLTAQKTSGQISEKGALAFYVQPDFELLLPPSVPSAIEWEVASFANLKSSDQVRTYQLTKESFLQALERGGDGKAIIDFLERYALYEISPGVLLTLHGWEEQHGKLVFMDVTLLRVHSVEIAEVVRKSEGCSPYIAERLNEVDFIVERKHVKPFVEQLTRMGYNPKNAVSKEEIPAAQNRFKAKELPKTRLFDSRAPYPLYDFAPILTRFEDLYPNLQDIPALWLKEYRDYHSSTRKDMIRQAIEWRSSLKLRKEGMERSVIPHSLLEDRNGWTLVGVEDNQEINLHSTDWEEMKLLLPGINDP
ncbi:helicase-associated domain-containing protein [Paenibacillus eucommiae]|uniref:Helicase XPB/Ssl2 N-terminal domain-containing protein n=1 Tax=Paenibacillus eucommiae TaxID=1355755 RepID=A0ABS4J9F1_9BACL|nr:helicase-associated domain-containing protein [Paenibacillus eucommiae]MBP1996472.1 hypothetical protein [Paenibacillus eucommiae]